MVLCGAVCGVQGWPCFVLGGRNGGGWLWWWWWLCQRLWWWWWWWWWWWLCQRLAGVVGGVRGDCGCGCRYRCRCRCGCRSGSGGKVRRHGFRWVQARGFVRRWSWWRIGCGLGAGCVAYSMVAVVLLLSVLCLWGSVLCWSDTSNNITNQHNKRKKIKKKMRAKTKKNYQEPATATTSKRNRPVRALVETPNNRRILGAIWQQCCA
eukprot:34381_6